MNVKDIQKFPVEIIRELEELCRIRLPNKTTRALEDDKKEDAGKWRNAQEKTVKRMFPKKIFLRFRKIRSKIEAKRSESIRFDERLSSSRC